MRKLANAGSSRLEGVEVSAVYRAAGHLITRAAYSYHDARFQDYLTEFDGVPTQLAGKRIEMLYYRMFPRRVELLASVLF